MFIYRKLYWTSGNRLLQSTLSVDNVEVLLTTSCSIRYLNLNVDLYWTRDCGAVESVHSLNPSTLQEIVIFESGGNDFYSGVTAYEDTVYWTALGRVNSAPVAGGGNLTELLYIPSYGTNFRGITVVHPDLQYDHTNTTTSSSQLFSSSKQATLSSSTTSSVLTSYKALPTISAFTSSSVKSPHTTVLLPPSSSLPSPIAFVPTSATTITSSPTLHPSPITSYTTTSSPTNIKHTHSTPTHSSYLQLTSSPLQSSLSPPTMSSDTQSSNYFVS